MSVRLFCVRSFLFAGLLVVGILADAQIKVLSTLHCEQIHDINDPAFIQGSEKFFDLRYTADEKVQITYSQDRISNAALFNADDTETSEWDGMNGRVFARWKNKAYVTLIDFGEGLRGSLMFPSNSDPAANPFGVPEIEVTCGLMRW